MDPLVNCELPGLVNEVVTFRGLQLSVALIPDHWWLRFRDIFSIRIVRSFMTVSVQGVARHCMRTCGREVVCSCREPFE